MIKTLLIRAAWAPLAVLIGHAAIVLVFGHQRALDPALHFLGGAAGAYFATHAIVLASAWFGHPSPGARSMIAFCLTATAALFWEFEEFATGQMSGHSSQFSLEETMADLLLGCGGALVFVVSTFVISVMRPAANR